MKITRNSSTKNQGKLQRWLTRAVAGLLIPSYLFAVCSKTYATPAAAEIIDFHNTTGQWNELLFGVQDLIMGSSPRRGDSLREPNQFLWIPGNNQAWAKFEYVGGGGTVEARPSSTDFNYLFPCEIRGGVALIGRYPRPAPTRDTEDPVVRCSVAYGSGWTAALPQSLPLASKMLELAQITRTPNPKYYYCTVAATGRGWWVHWGQNDSPCEAAYQSCYGTGAGDRCQLMSAGSWAAREEDLLAVVSCENDRVYPSRGTGREMDSEVISRLVQTALGSNSGTCTFDLYRDNQLSVLPLSSQRGNRILAQSSQTNVTIDALSGDVKIRSTLNPAGFILTEGNRYLFPQDVIQPIRNQPSNTAATARRVEGTSVRAVRAINEGDVAQTILDVSLNNPAFRITRDGCTNTTLAPGATCTVDVEYPPEGAGPDDSLVFSGSGDTAIYRLADIPETP